MDFNFKNFLLIISFIIVLCVVIFIYKVIIRIFANLFHVEKKCFCADCHESYVLGNELLYNFCPYCGKELTVFPANINFLNTEERDELSKFKILLKLKNETLSEILENDLVTDEDMENSELNFRDFLLTEYVVLSPNVRTYLKYNKDFRKLLKSCSIDLKTFKW